MSGFLSGLSGSQTPASSRKWDSPHHGRFTELIDEPDTEYEPDSDGSEDPEDSDQSDEEDNCPITVEIEISEPEGESGWQASGYGQFEEWEDARYHAENIQELRVYAYVLRQVMELKKRSQRAPRPPPPEDVYPKVPSEVGKELMASGWFGSNPNDIHGSKQHRRDLSTKLMQRQLGAATEQKTRSILQDFIPGTVSDKIMHFDSRCYSGEFSEDGNFFFCCSQDFQVRMYDTSDPYEWKYYKTVHYPFGQWSITDATLSPDNRFLAYTSLRNTVYLAPTDPNDLSEPTVLDFGNNKSCVNSGILSLRFSRDGREMIAGTNDPSVVIYDLETRTPILSLPNHRRDVNAVCVGDSSCPFIIYTGSDDTTLRVWDRRSMADGREVGVFLGHREGLTYIDSKADGRYVLSNGKDQLMKLWDLRKMMTMSEFDDFKLDLPAETFDYQHSSYSREDYRPHPNDCSLVTFRGHQVLKTLIRCHFSPPGSTNSRYVYTASSDGKVYIYNLDATLAGTIDVRLSTMFSRPQDDDLRIFEVEYVNNWVTCVRDASWHPSAPVLAATSWNGWGMSSGTCTLHSWNPLATLTLGDDGDSPLGKNYNSELESVPEFNTYMEKIRARVCGRLAPAHVKRS